MSVRQPFIVARSVVLGFSCVMLQYCESTVIHKFKKSFVIDVMKTVIVIFIINMEFALMLAVEC